MQESCHRCHAELPRSSSAPGGSDEAQALFCPRCGAPQLRLAEGVQSVWAARPGSSTGNAPPPHPAGLDAGAALRCALPVALIAAALKLLAFFFVAAARLSDLWILLAPGVVVLLYARRLPGRRLGARGGLRIGLLTGVLVAATIGCTLPAAGVLLRFPLHRAGVLDGAVAGEVAATRRSMATVAAQQGAPADVQAVYNEWVESPEVQAGTLLAYLLLRAGMLLLVCAAGGALAGSAVQRGGIGAPPVRHA